MKNILLIAFTAVLCTFVLIGCGADKNNNSEINENSSIVDDGRKSSAGNTIDEIEDDIQEGEKDVSDRVHDAIDGVEDAADDLIEGGGNAAHDIVDGITD